MKLSSVLCALVLVAACGKKTTPPTDDLPAAPQLFPSDNGFAVFPLTAANSSSSQEIGLLNGGQQPLVVSSVSISGPDSLSVDSAPTSASPITSRDSGIVSLSFNPTDRGVSLATLSIDSNAENIPHVTIEVIGPAGSSPLADGPDIAPFADSFAAGSVFGLDGNVALVRLFNVGAGAAALTQYQIVDDADGAFAFLDGSATPGAACDISNPCGAHAACSDGTCPAVVLGAGLFLVLGVNQVQSGAHTAHVIVSYVDPLDNTAGSIDVQVTVTSS